MRQYLIGLIMRIGDEALCALRPRIADDALDKGYAGHGNERLGLVFRQRAHASAEACR